MHPKLLELTVAKCHAYMDAGDYHGEAPLIERLIDAVTQLDRDLTYYKGIAERYTERLLHKAGAVGVLGDASITGDVHPTSDDAFLATRLRRLFAHFSFPLPDFAADDARLIRIAGSAIGMILTRLETAEPVAWVNGDELRKKANATIACGAEQRKVAGHAYDTPLYEVTRRPIQCDGRGEAVLLMNQKTPSTMTTNTPAAAAITAERTILAFGEGPWHVEHRTNAASDICDSHGRVVASCAWHEGAGRRAEQLCDMLNAALSAPVAAQPAAFTVDGGTLGALERAMARQEEIAQEIDLANPGDPYASLMVREDIEVLEALRAHLSTALGDKK